jgi:nicotinamidase/pyrazinamidase
MIACRMLGILLVDPQFDFFPGGTLAVAHGDDIIAPINRMLQQHDRAPLFASRDWHRPHTKHFRDGGGIWPPHCVEHSRGAAFHDGIAMHHARVFNKGTDPNDDGGYSAFDGAHIDTGASLIADLRAHNVDTLLVAGLATDHCVKASVLDARKHGLDVFVLAAGVRAVNVVAGDGDRAVFSMREAGAYWIST